MVRLPGSELCHMIQEEITITESRKMTSKTMVLVILAVHKGYADVFSLMYYSWLLKFSVWNYFQMKDFLLKKLKSLAAERVISNRIPDGTSGKTGQAGLPRVKPSLMSFSGPGVPPGTQLGNH